MGFAWHGYPLEYNIFELGCVENLKFFMGFLLFFLTCNVQARRDAFQGRGDRWLVPLDEFAGLVYLLNESGLKIKEFCR